MESSPFANTELSMGKQSGLAPGHMLWLDRGRGRLAGLKSREKYYAACVFCVSFEHLLRKLL
jgi:hypothetical protein